MARTDYGPEAKAAMDEPPSPPRPKAPGQIVNRAARKEVVPGHAADSAAETRTPTPRVEADQVPRNAPGMPMRAPRSGEMPMQAPDAHHVAAAASIAHAILNRRGVG